MSALQGVDLGLGQEHFALQIHAPSSGDLLIDANVRVKIDKARSESRFVQVYALQAYQCGP